MSTAAPITAAAPEVARFLQTFGFEHRTTMNVLRAIPADQLGFRPHERNMTAGELAWHIATAQLHIAQCVALGRFELRLFTAAPAPATIEEIVAGCESQYQQTCEALAPLTSEHLQQKIEMPGGHRLPASALMWSGVLFHQIHHRGQLSIYIRMMGGKVPSIYGPSGDSA